MNYILEYNDVVQQLSTEYARRYGMLERDDIAQELWVWFVGHPRKYKEWSELEQKDKDKLIAKSLRNAALKYCEREKANKVGYDSSDLYYTIMMHQLSKHFFLQSSREPMQSQLVFKTLTLSSGVETYLMGTTGSLLGQTLQRHSTNYLMQSKTY